jgi:protein-arginine kinase activator protein McsA
MICEGCHKQEAIVDWHSEGRMLIQSQHLRLCQDCADARTSPEVLQRIREARERGETGAISGWTSYSPAPNTDDKP